MDHSTSKEKILKKIRKALLQKNTSYTAPVDTESAIYTDEPGELTEVFSANFLSNNGNFYYCYNEFDFLDRFLTEAEQKGWSKAICFEKHFHTLFESCSFSIITKYAGIKEAEVGITGCEALLARTGSVVVSSSHNGGRAISVYPPTHVAIAYRNQMVFDLKDYLSSGIEAGKAMPSMFSIISGPSRTADIEKTLVLGAHGPKEIHVFYIDQDKLV